MHVSNVSNEIINLNMNEFIPNYAKNTAIVFSKIRSIFSKIYPGLLMYYFLTS